MTQPDLTTRTTTPPSASRGAGSRDRRPVRTAVLPPVPLSVWLSEPLTGCCPTCEQPVSTACIERLPLALARQITHAYSRSGEIVCVPDAGNGTLLLAAARTGRKVLALVRGSNHGRRTHALLTSEEPVTAARAIIRNAPGPAALAQQAARITSRAALAVIAPHNPTTPAALGALLDAAHRALRPEGVLVLCTRQTSGHDSTGTLTAYAQAAGFTYLQHIAAVEATATGSGLLPLPPTPAHGPDCTCTNTHTPAGGHRVAHNDLLAFQRP